MNTQEEKMKPRREEMKTGREITSDEDGCDEDDVEVDETLYSRQIYTYGDLASRKLATASVLICGLGGVGVEVAKNVILTGVHQVVLHDSQVTTWEDLATQFYLTEADLGNNRALACVDRLAQLNPNVQVITTFDPQFNPFISTVTPAENEAATTTNENALKNGVCSLANELIKKFTVVVLTECTFEEQMLFDNACRHQEVPLVMADAKGLCGQVFCDFGDNFYVDDPTDRDLASFPIMDISSEVEEGVLSLPNNIYHGLWNGDHITFSGVNGMTQLNNTTRKIKVVDGRHLMIGSTVGLGEYKGGGAAKEVRQGSTFTHKPLSSTLLHPSIEPIDFSKPGRNILLHLAFLALHRYQAIHSTLPRPWHQEDADIFISLCRQLRKEGLGCEEDSEGKAVSELGTEEIKLLRLYSYTSSGSVAGIVSVVGGVAAGEVVKACARRFSPLTQFLYFDAVECLPKNYFHEEQVLHLDTVPRRSRYDGLASVIGWDVVEQMLKMQVMVVGAGAVGCEIMKCLALYGVGAGKEGMITLTDHDLIERSNLSRQFLFRPWHVRQHKAKVAAQEARAINPELHVVPQILQAGSNNRHILDTSFYEHQHTVFAAVDSAEARRHLDSCCRVAGIPLIEAGTHGTRGSTTVVVPHLTECYTTLETTSGKSAPACTLRNFPTTVDHLIQWANNLLFEEFCLIPTLASRYLSGTLTLTQLNLEGLSVVNGVQSVFLKTPNCYKDCVMWATQRLTHHFNSDILDLLHHFPPDLTLENGCHFWSGARRCPCPISLDPRNHLHLMYIHATANLRAKVFSIPEEQDLGWTVTLLGRMTEQVIEDKAGDKIELPSFTALPSLSLTPLTLDKDDSLQLDYVVAAARLRGTNFHIPPGDLLSLRSAAGRITPAVVTSSAVVAGLACLELLKVAQHHSHLEDYRTAEFNLALSRYSLISPESAPLKMYNGIEWTDWDKFEIEGDMTLHELSEFFRVYHDLQLTMVSSDNFTLHSDFLSAHEKERRRNMRITEILKELMNEDKRDYDKGGTDEKEELKIGSVIILDICADDREGEDIDVPFVRMNIGKNSDK